MIQEEFTKANLNKMLEKDMATKNMTIKTSTLDISKREKHMVKAFTHGLMGSTTKENGTWAKSMVLESGKETGANLILETGNSEKQMGKVLTLGETETFTKETGWTA